MRKSVDPRPILPVIDFTGIRDHDAAATSRAAREITAACTGAGFFYITGHGLPQTTIDRAVTAATAFFALPLERKRAVSLERHRGFVTMGGAHMVGASLPDYKESNGGLQIKDRATKEWIDVPPIPGTLVINIGDLLERWSNDRFASTPHRVINRSGNERYSLATFYDRTFGAVADPRDLGTPQSECRYEPVRAGEYILKRVADAFGYRERTTTNVPG